jgi:nucleoside diphosphate kinase
MKDSNLDRQINTSDLALTTENRDRRLDAGQSKRIWEELYKVLDSSDVVCMVLDARYFISHLTKLETPRGPAPVTSRTTSRTTALTST